VFIPRYWAEAVHREILPPRRQVTVRRFGWSSTNQADADVHARTRVEEAVAILKQTGPKGLSAFTRVERKVAYSGADGLPIREEIVLERADLDVVVTRNSYGALCLNTPVAMFVDVDLPISRAPILGCLAALVGAVAGIVVGRLAFRANWFLSAAVGLCALSVGVTILTRLRERTNLRFRDPLRYAVKRCRDWCAGHPGWRIAAYATPAGARVLPLQATFDAADEKTFQFMEHVGVDPLYARMCRLQKCFRARVSPKWWRTKLNQRFHAGGTWPVTDPRKLAERASWVRSYDEVARGHASCHLVDVVGEGPTDPRIAEIRTLHDEMCRAESQLPLA
jgi:hypothetical protein